MPKPLFSRVLYKISGEALMGNQGFGIDPNMVDRIVSDVIEAHELGISIALVVGGGNICRGVSLAIEGGDRVTFDHMGMLAIVINALALRTAFESRKVKVTLLSGLAVPQVCELFTQRALAIAREAGDIIIFAGGIGSPYFTSDTAAALRASEFGADVLIKGTQVDGIYSEDPQKNPDAERFDTLKHKDIIERGLHIMDASAVMLAEDNNIDLIVFSIHEKGGLMRVLLGQGRFTRVSQDRVRV
ncbi:UMP kinase [Candidatus Endowatersipora endosymbiont of Watersipora subatra]|uniref:UMP kinase n=1 Tax=Candidatus Endowatersipora endosymbiont of Watersipora subatra TaxID=3077946 RepID=UPI00312C7CCA